MSQGKETYDDIFVILTYKNTKDKRRGVHAEASGEISAISFKSRTRREGKGRGTGE